MPAETPIYAFPYEEWGDQPGHSLHGGEAGTEPILAEEVEEELNRIETVSIAGLEERIEELEAAAAVPRWEQVSSGTATGGAFSIPVTAGAYSQLRLTMTGDLDGDGSVELRINGDSTAGLHRYGLLVRDAAGALDSSLFADATVWRLAEWGTVTRNSVVCHMIGTDINEFVTYQATGTRISSSATSHTWSQSWGRLVTARLVSSLNVRPQQAAGTPGFAALNWWLEGYPA